MLNEKRKSWAISGHSGPGSRLFEGFQPGPCSYDNHTVVRVDGAGRVELGYGRESGGAGWFNQQPVLFCDVKHRFVNLHVRHFQGDSSGLAETLEDPASGERLGDLQSFCDRLWRFPPCDFRPSFVVGINHRGASSWLDRDNSGPVAYPS